MLNPKVVAKVTPPGVSISNNKTIVALLTMEMPLKASRTELTCTVLLHCKCENIQYLPRQEKKENLVCLYQIDGYNAAMQTVVGSLVLLIYLLK